VWKAGHSVVFSMYCCCHVSSLERFLWSVVGMFGQLKGLLYRWGVLFVHCCSFVLWACCRVSVVLKYGWVAVGFVDVGSPVVLRLLVSEIGIRSVGIVISCWDMWCRKCELDCPLSKDVVLCVRVT
jgi:hypothetical protein